jgi:hypothetical protein
MHPRITAGGDIEDTLPVVAASADETVVAGSLFLAGAARSLARAGRLAADRPPAGARPGPAA